MFKANYSKGEDVLFIIGIVAVIFLMLLGRGKFIPSMGGPLIGTTSTSVYSSSGSSSQIGNTTLSEGNASPWYGKVTIQSGNTYEIQPSREYIYLYAQDVPVEGVNITGWSLSNGKGNKFTNLGGNQVKLQSDVAVIPQAAKLFITKGSNFLGPIILGKGEKAAIITGDVQNKNPFVVTSFKVNKCSGYLENLPTYEFYPYMYTSCPYPAAEVGVESLDDDCYKFVRSMATCRTPKEKDSTRIGNNIERGCVDGVCGLSSQCKAFIASHYSYESCVALHSEDKDFYLPEWRVYLNKSWEMWANERETITLFDKEGRVVNKISY
jgi:hypothetical protein